jgi:hypothetical protein
MRLCPLEDVAVIGYPPVDLTAHLQMTPFLSKKSSVQLGCEDLNPQAIVTSGLK